jgi:hypothetical protein
MDGFGEIEFARGTIQGPRLPERSKFRPCVTLNLPCRMVEDVRQGSLTGDVAATLANDESNLSFVVAFD